MLRCAAEKDLVCSAQNGVDVLRLGKAVAKTVLVEQMNKLFKDGNFSLTFSIVESLPKTHSLEPPLKLRFKAPL